MIYLQLFFEFFKTGLFVVGGGMAAVPFLYDISKRTGWFTEQMLADMIAVSESTPGPIGVNMATYVGYTTAGVFGSVAATLGIIIPSVIIMQIVARLFVKLNEKPLVKAAFYGLNPAVVGLISAAAFQVLNISVLNINNIVSLESIFAGINPIALALFCVLLIAMLYFKKAHPIFFLAAAAAAGIVFGL